MIVMTVLSLRDRQTTHVFEMMKVLGIEPGGGVVPWLGLKYTAASHRCESCTAKQACCDWLDRTPDSAMFAPQFCPNAHILFELQVDQPTRSSH
jgi:Family of unknown function (DUF6455)